MSPPRCRHSTRVDGGTLRLNFHAGQWPGRGRATGGSSPSSPGPRAARRQLGPVLALAGDRAARAGRLPRGHLDLRPVQAEDAPGSGTCSSTVLRCGPVLGGRPDHRAGRPRHRASSWRTGRRPDVGPDHPPVGRERSGLESTTAKGRGSTRRAARVHADDVGGRPPAALAQPRPRPAHDDPLQPRLAQEERLRPLEGRRPGLRRRPVRLDGEPAVPPKEEAERAGRRCRSGGSTCSTGAGSSGPAGLIYDSFDESAQGPPVRHPRRVAPLPGARLRRGQHGGRLLRGRARHPKRSTSTASTRPGAGPRPSTPGPARRASPDPDVRGRVEVRVASGGPTVPGRSPACRSGARRQGSRGRDRPGLRRPQAGRDPRLRRPGQGEGTTSTRSGPTPASSTPRASPGRSWAGRLRPSGPPSGVPRPSS
jgi:hypothetical protein